MTMVASIWRCTSRAWSVVFDERGRPFSPHGDDVTFEVCAWRIPFPRLHSPVARGTWSTRAETI